MRLEIQLPGGECVNVWGEVVYQMSEIGFGVRFTILTQDEAQPLAKLLSSAKEVEKSTAPPTRQKKSSSIRA